MLWCVHINCVGFKTNISRSIFKENKKTYTKIINKWWIKSNSISKMLLLLFDVQFHNLTNKSNVHEFGFQIGFWSSMKSKLCFFLYFKTQKTNDYRIIEFHKSNKYQMSEMQLNLWGKRKKNMAFVCKQANIYILAPLYTIIKGRTTLMKIAFNLNQNWSADAGMAQTIQFLINSNQNKTKRKKKHW